MSYRSAFFVLFGVFVLHFSRILFYGEVIFPHDNSLEVGLPEKPNGTRISNRKFSDESGVFIPELANNLRSDRKAWLATWNPHVQLGRAAFHGALSRAFALTNLLSCFTSNPFVLYTALVLLTVELTGIFLLLFLRSLGLHPAACGLSALGLALTTPASYWLSFVMFLIGHLLDGMFVVPQYGIYAKTIVACSAWTGFLPPTVCLWRAIRRSRFCLPTSQGGLP